MTTESQTIREQIAGYWQHKPNCALSTKLLIPSRRGELPDAWFRHFGCQCNHPIESLNGCYTTHCQLRAGHASPHKGDRGDGLTEWESGECTCGLQQAADRLASLEQQMQEQEKTLGSCSTTEVPEAADGGVVEHSSSYGRPETGPMRFGDDWTGVFIRGDNAFGFALALSIVCDAAGQAEAHPLYVAQARGLLGLLHSSNEMKPVAPQQMRPFADAVESAKSVENASASVDKHPSDPQDSKESLLAQVASLEQAQQALTELKAIINDDGSLTTFEEHRDICAENVALVNNMNRALREFDALREDHSRLRVQFQRLIEKWREIGGRPQRPTGFLLCADELETLLTENAGHNQ